MSTLTIGKYTLNHFDLGAKEEMDKYLDLINLDISDYTFACNDFLALDIAICLNALCFEEIGDNYNFNILNAKNSITQSDGNVIDEISIAYEVPTA